MYSHLTKVRVTPCSERLKEERVSDEESVCTLSLLVEGNHHYIWAGYYNFLWPSGDGNLVNFCYCEMMYKKVVGCEQIVVPSYVIMVLKHELSNG